MDFSKWKTKVVSVNRLRLDPENPRLATSVKRPTQRELIEDLLVHEKVLELVRDVAQLGFFPNELLVAVRDGANTIIIEGNRRLAALKLLLNPELSPPAFQKRVVHHAERNPHKIEKIMILIAPSRDAAVPLIIARHKGNAIQAWTTIMQARFIQSRIEHGLSVAQVADETGLDRPEVLRQLRDAKLYDVIRSLDLPRDVAQVASDPRQFPFTTLRRLIEYSSVRDFLGIVNHEQHGFVTHMLPEQFQVALARIVQDIARDIVTSRTHNTSAQIESYIRSLQAFVGPSRRKSRKALPADDFVDPSKLQPTARRPRTTPRKPSAPVGLLPRGFRVDIDDHRICAIVDELKGIRIEKFPNATAIVFRSLLDMAITRYLHNEGELQRLIAKLSKNQRRPADWVPTLKQQLAHILTVPSIPLPPDGRKSLQKFLSDTQNSLTLEVLNWFTHNRYVPPTPDELRAFLVMLTPLFELALQEQEHA